MSNIVNRSKGVFRGLFCLPKLGVLKFWVGEHFCTYEKWPTQEKKSPIGDLGAQ